MLGLSNYPRVLGEKINLVIGLFPTTIIIVFLLLLFLILLLLWQLGSPTKLLTVLLLKDTIVNES